MDYRTIIHIPCLSPIGFGVISGTIQFAFLSPANHSPLEIDMVYLKQASLAQHGSLELPSPFLHDSLGASG